MVDKSSVTLVDLLNNIWRQAAENGISVKFKITELDWGFLTALELTSLFVNLLNNAIEACKLLQPDKRWMALRIGEAQQHVVISLCNPYANEQLLGRSGKFIFTKASNCGSGLGKVNQIIEKYNGNMFIETQYALFIVKIIIPSENIL